MTTRLPHLRRRRHSDDGEGRARIEDHIRVLSGQVERTMTRVTPTRYIPGGGTAGQVLKKIDERDFNVRWGAIPFPIFNVRDYGAVGDDSTDDSDAFQDAIDALIAAGGGSLYAPSGIYKIVTGLNCDGQLASDPAAFGINIVGDSRRTSKIKSYLATADDMLFIGNGSGTPQNGVTIRDVCFCASLNGSAQTISSEASLLRLDYALDARVENVLFLDGANTQLWVGRPQNTLITGCEFRGDEAITDYCVYLTNAPSGNGQGALIERCTVRGARGTDGVGIWATQDGGGEHNIAFCMIEGNKVGIRLQSLRHNVFACSFENGNNSDFVAQIEVGASGVRAQHHNISYCTFSASSQSNRKCIDLISYNNIRITHNRIFNENGTHVYFGSDENNSPSYFTDNECPMSALSLGGNEGKVIIERNSANGTNNPRATAADADATPSVANADVLATANTGATTITDFDDGHPGKLFMLSVEDANTTVANNANIVTLTGANLTPANGTKYVFMAHVGSSPTATLVWIQIK